LVHELVMLSSKWKVWEQQLTRALAMGSGGATGLGLSLSTVSMTRLDEYLSYRCWNAK
jgi:hypothetical protein